MPKDVLAIRVLTFGYWFGGTERWKVLKVPSKSFWIWISHKIWPTSFTTLWVLNWTSEVLRHSQRYIKLYLYMLAIQKGMFQVNDYISYPTGRGTSQTDAGSSQTGTGSLRPAQAFPDRRRLSKTDAGPSQTCARPLRLAQALLTRRSLRQVRSIQVLSDRRGALSDWLRILLDRRRALSDRHKPSPTDAGPLRPMLDPLRPVLSDRHKPS